jgi:hypothetical protein
MPMFASGASAGEVPAACAIAGGGWGESGDTNSGCRDPLDCEPSQAETINQNSSNRPCLYMLDSTFRVVLGRKDGTADFGLKQIVGPKFGSSQIEKFLKFCDLPLFSHLEI